MECGIRSDETFLFTSFFWTYAALIITIVAVSVLSGKLSYVDKETNERSQTKTKQNNPPQTQRKHQNMSKTDHGEKVKQVQALTAIYTSPALTSSSAGNSQGRINGLAAMCKQEYSRLASSFSFCQLTHLADFQVPIKHALSLVLGHKCT